MLTFWNAGGGRCRYLIVLTRLAALIEGLHEPGVDIPALFAEYDSALVG